MVIAGSSIKTLCTVTRKKMIRLQKQIQKVIILTIMNYNKQLKQNKYSKPKAHIECMINHNIIISKTLNLRKYDHIIFQMVYHVELSTVPNRKINPKKGQKKTKWNALTSFLTYCNSTSQGYNHESKEEKNVTLCVRTPQKWPFIF